MAVELDRARIWVSLPFLGALCLQLALIGWTFQRGEIRAATLAELFLTLFAVYSIPFGTIAGGIFAEGRRRRRVSPSILWFAVALSLLWNTLLATRTAFFAISSNDSAASLQDYHTRVAAASMFLVAAALTYFFAKQEE